MNPALGTLALTPMNAETINVEDVFRDFKQCLNTFDDWAESFWISSALEMEQLFKVGDEVALTAPVSSKVPSTTVATCKASGQLTLVHMFESTRFVPIGNTPVKLQAIAYDGSPLGAPTHNLIDV